ncbi:MAG: T9SS type A sorting domain-containing protein [Rufibacter sp.]
MKKTLLRLTISAALLGIWAPEAAFAQTTAPAFTNDPVVTANTSLPFFGVNAASTGQGVAVDPDGKVWTLSNQRGIVIYNRNGTPFKFPESQAKIGYTAATSSIPEYISSIVFSSKTFDLDGTGTTGGGRGLRRSLDGNILLVTNNSWIIKLNYKTGEPIAYFDTGTSVNFPSDDVNGNIFVTSVTGNASWIVKPVAGQEVMQAVKANFVLPERPINTSGATPAAAISRNATLTPDGRTLYVSYDNTEGVINKYTSTDGLNWVFDSKIDLQGFFTNALYAPTNNMLYYVTYKGTGAGASNYKFVMKDMANASASWEMDFPSAFASVADLRGIDMTPGRDTAYFVSGTSARLYRFIAPPGSVTSSKREVLARSIHAFPVPTQGKVYLDLPESVRRSASVKLTDLSGKDTFVKADFSGTYSEIDLSSLAAGTYLLILDTTEGRSIKRIVKQ